MRKVYCLLILLACAGTALAGENVEFKWRELVTDAYDRSDAVLRGTVLDIDDQTAIDGGHVYTIQVNEQHKGIADETVTVRAGGFFYIVPLERGEEVVLFLTADGRRGPDYRVSEVEVMRPMVFRMSNDQVVAVDGRLQSQFTSVLKGEMDLVLGNQGN